MIACINPEKWSVISDRPKALGKPLPPRILDRRAPAMVVMARIIRTANMAAGLSASTPDPNRSQMASVT
jgi:hypothetical protein